MRRTILVISLAAGAVFFLWAQRERATDHAPYEVRSVFPREVSPAQYQQVEQQELRDLSGQGWELVAVVPYIYRNEERGTAAMAPRPMVTQTYPAYFFKRLRTSR
jgi:hypothetical protein